MVEFVKHEPLKRRERLPTYYWDNVIRDFLNSRMSCGHLKNVSCSKYTSLLNAIRRMKKNEEVVVLKRNSQLYLQRVEIEGRG